MTVECHSQFVDPGASSMAAPLAIAAGMDYSLALKFDGTVIEWGFGGDGATGVPADLTNAVAIAAGTFHSLALRSDGTVVGWGSDYGGETTPPPGLSNVVAIAAGDMYSLALESRGTVVSWGYSYGDQNVPAGLTNAVAIAAGSFHALALKSDGTVVGWGNDADGEIDIPTSLSNVVAIAAGWNHSLALRSDGQVIGWGQTSVPAGLSNVVAIAAGDFYSLALRSDGTVVGWGFDFYGQASGAATLSKVMAIAAGGYHSLAIEAGGTLVAWGYDLYGQTDIPSDFGGKIQVSGAVNPNVPLTYTLAYMATNSLGGTGITTRTVVVADTTPPTLVLRGANPMTVPVNTVFADPGATAVDACAGDLTSNILVTGSVDTTQLGTNNLTYTVADPSGNVTVTNRTVITVVGSPFVTTLPASGTNHSAILSGTVNPNGGMTMAWFEWGTNLLHGQTTAPVAIGSGLTNVPLLASLGGLTPGTTYNYRIVATNSAGRSSGRDTVFQNLPNAVAAPAVMLVGTNPLTNECHTPFVDPGAVVIAPLAAIAAGGYYSLALKTDGTVGAWGNPPTVPAGLNNVKAISAGYIHCLALKADGTVVGWGDNTFGETNTPAGLSNVVAVATGWGYSLALKADGSLVGWGTNDFTPAPIPSGLNNVVAISVGFDLCLALKQDGKVVGWGQPPFGGTTPPDGLSNVVAIAAGESYGLALRSDGTVVGWGYNGEGQVSIPEGLSNVVSIAAGFYHSLALKADGTVVGWGDNFYGEASPPPGLKNVIAIAAAPYHSLALKRDGTVVGWGFGPYGETDITTSATNLVTHIHSASTVNPSDPGRYLLTYTATNSAGLVTTLHRTVLVVDTTPPTIVCPADRTVEFGTEAGTMLSFRPAATDLCSPFVSVTCVPPSGSVFHIGTTTVQCTARDPSGNSAVCGFQVTVLGAQGVNSNVLSELRALHNPLPPPPDWWEFNAAISNLQQSLLPALWTDQTHLVKTKGVIAFNEGQAAVQALARLMKDSPPSIPRETLHAFIVRIIKSDHLLAVVAMRDAAQAGASPGKLAAAGQNVTRGDAAAVNGQYGPAIQYYEQAWSEAVN